MKSLRTKIAAVVIAAAAMIAAPAAANAYTTDATPVSPGQSISIVPGGPITLAVNVTGLPSADTRVVFTLSGEGVGPANLAVVKAANTSYSVTKDRSSAAPTVTLPSNATGTYTLATKGEQSSTELAPITITVAAAGGGAGGGSGLPATGVDSASLMGVWIGGGVLLLGGLAVTVFAVRRQRQDA